MVRSEDWPAALDWVKQKRLRAGVLAGPSICETARFETAAVYMYADDTVEAAAKRTFAGLRALDESIAGLEIILAAAFPGDRDGQRLYESLEKSSQSKFFQVK